MLRRTKDGQQWQLCVESDATRCFHWTNIGEYREIASGGKEDRLLNAIGFRATGFTDYRLSALSRTSGASRSI